MYNMDINGIVKQMQEFKLFGLKFRLEVVLLCVALGYVIGAHLFCSCLTVNPQEGFQLLTDIKDMVMNRLTGKSVSGSGSGSGIGGDGSDSYKSNKSQSKVRNPQLY